MKLVRIAAMTGMVLVLGLLGVGAAYAQNNEAAPPAEADVPEQVDETPATAQGEAGQQEEDVQLPATTVTEGPLEEEEGYRAEEASTATKTDTPIMETPRSVQVITEALLEDQQALSLEDALRNVSSTIFVDSGEGLQIFSRGFSAGVFRDGFPLTEFSDGDVRSSDLDLYNVERIEVLKGPASVLYGRGNPGGTINIITKKPQAEPAYRFGTKIGSFDRVRSSFDLTGPLADEGEIRYRITGLYETADSFRDEVESEQIGIAPSIAFDLSPDTTLRFNVEYFDLEQTPDGGVPSLNGEVFPGVSNDTFLGEPSDLMTDQKIMARATLIHDFNDAWQWRTAMRAARTETQNLFTRPDGLEADNRTATRSFIDSEFNIDDYRVQSQLTGEFETGVFDHNVLFGAEFGRREIYSRFGSAPADTIDIFNPVYGPGGPQGSPFYTFLSESERDFGGLFVQDQISYTEQWHLLLGGRYDYIDQTIVSGLVGNLTEQPSKVDQHFSPNAGLVYRPIEPLSLYVNWSESFQQQNGVPVNIQGDVLDPEVATLYEAGVKWSLMEDRLGGTLSFYHIDKENARTADQDNPGFQKAFGEVESRGIELDVSGQITPGWRVLAAYGYNDSQITRETNLSLIGNRPREIPTHTARLWSTYEFLEGDLRGLGFGGGVTYIGERPANDANSYDLPAYTTVDAAIFYKLPQFTARLNFYNLLDNDDIVTSSARGTFVRPGAPFSVLASLEFKF